MDDFSIPGRSNGYNLPPSPANFIEPYKRPLSSMCPTILLDENGQVELLIGSAGGSKITSSVAYVSERKQNIFCPQIILYLSTSGINEIFILQRICLGCRACTTATSSAATNGTFVRARFFRRNCDWIAVFWPHHDENKSRFGLCISDSHWTRRKQTGACLRSEKTWQYQRFLVCSR